MYKYLFCLFFPSICMLLSAFILWLIFIKIPQFWDRVFGEHTVLIIDINKTTIERRRNFDDKVTSSVSYPEFSSFYINPYCGFTQQYIEDIPHEQTKRREHGL